MVKLRSLALAVVFGAGLFTFAAVAPPSSAVAPAPAAAGWCPSDDYVSKTRTEYYTSYGWVTSRVSAKVDWNCWGTKASVDYGRAWADTSRYWLPSCVYARVSGVTATGTFSVPLGVTVGIGSVGDGWYRKCTAAYAGSAPSINLEGVEVGRWNLLWVKFEVCWSRGPYYPRINCTLERIFA